MAQGVGRQAFDVARSQKAEAVARALAEQEKNRLRRGAYDGLTGAGLSGQSARTLTGVLDYVPVVGDVAGAEDTYQAARAGDWTGAGVAGAATLLGVLPGVGDFAGKMVRAAADGGGGAAKGIRAFHGSPHDFDRFDTSKIGTGEGAQAYGHGLYFAESEGVARNYRDTLSRPSFLERGDGAPIPGDLQRMFDDAWNDLRGTTYGADMQGAADLVMQKLDRQRADALKAGDMEWFDRVMDYRAEVGRIRDNPPLTAGRMYEVRINAEPDAFLDWDRPLSEQPETLQRMAREADIARVPTRLRRQLEAWRGEWTPPPGVEVSEPTGSQLHSALTDFGTSTTDNAALTERLREAGIPGIRYLDAGSRSSGDGSRNYVVFDDSLVEIVRKYGLAGLMAMGGIGAVYGAPPVQEQ